MTNEKPVKKSPIFPAGQRWEAKPDPHFYESDATALIRTMLDNPEVREDQDWAWQRWRSGNNAIKQD